MSPRSNNDSTDGLYAAAQSAHYGKKDLRRALEIYRQIVTSHPESQEAQFSRSQIQSIAKSVVPELKFLLGQVKIAIDHLDSGDRHQVEPKPDRLLQSEQTTYSESVPNASTIRLPAGTLRQDEVLDAETFIRKVHLSDRLMTGTPSPATASSAARNSTKNAWEYKHAREEC